MPGPVARVCVLSESYLPQRGGTPTQIRAMVAGLRERGFASFVVTRRSSLDNPAEDLIDGVKVYRIGPVGLGPSKKWGMLTSSFRALIRLRKEYDIIYVPGFRVIGVSAVVAAKLLKKKTVFRAVSRGEMSGAFFKSGLTGRSCAFKFMFAAFSLLRSAVLRRADRYVSISSPMRRELRECGVASRRIVDIPNGIDPQLYRPPEDRAKLALRRKIGVPEDAFVGVYTGRLVRYKGLATLMNAFGDFSRAVPEARLLVVGEGGNDMHNCNDELRDLVAATRIEDKVKFVGAVENVLEHLQLADCFLFPTEDEAFGISLIEAMSCGLPVVSTDVGGIADYLEDGDNGLIVEIGDSQGLARAMELLHSNPRLREKLGSSGRATAAERFAQERIDSDYAELFESLLRVEER